MNKVQLLQNGKNTRDRGLLLLLFLISPILSLSIAIVNYSRKHYHGIIILFAFLYGYTFIPIENSDTTRYLDYYNVVSNYNLTEFISQILHTYTLDSRFNDFYVTTLMYMCSVFSLSFKFFLGLHAVIYFSLLLSIINLILRNNSKLYHRKYLVFIIGSIMIYSFSGAITGIRFQVGFMFLILFSLKYIFSGKIRYILLAAGSCLIHISIIPVYLGLLLFYLLGKVRSFKLKLFFILIFLAALYNVNVFEYGQGIEVLDQKVEGYTNEDYVESREAHTEDWNWYVQINQYATYYFLIGALLLTRVKHLKLKSNKIINDLLLFAIILLVISLFNETLLDSITNRYRLFFQFIGLVYLFFISCYNRNNNLTTILKNVYIPILTLSVLINLRVDSYTIDLIRLTLSPVFTILGFDGANIYNII